GRDGHLACCDRVRRCLRRGDAGAVRERQPARCGARRWAGGGGSCAGGDAAAARGLARDLGAVRAGARGQRGGVGAEVIGTIAAGLAGGVVAGMLGVGGGVLFVPALVLFMNLSQHHAEATSLLAIIPVALVGAYRQDRYGNVRRTDALLLGCLSIEGAVAGVAVATALSGEVLCDSFAAFMVLVAGQPVRRALRERAHAPNRGEP